MPTPSPLLQGDDAGRAMDAVSDVVAVLTPDVLGGIGHALGSGTPGAAMLHVALFEATGDESHRDRAIALFDTAIDAVSAQPRIDPAFFGTTIGVGWAISAAGTRLGEDDPDENDIDELVLRLASMAPWPGHFDLVSGLTGLGAYCLSRVPRPSARAALDAVVARLGELAVRGDAGTAWLTTPAIYAPRSEAFPEGHWDVGFAHGTAGVVGMLAGATRAGAAGAETLLRESLAWLVSWREPGADSEFPAIVGPDGAGGSSRMAWCYGDPGVSIALLAAGRALGDAAVVESAREVALSCVGRVESSAAVDAGLCHGSVGAAHLFHRIGRALDEGRLLDLARFWFARGLDERSPDGGIAGFAGTDAASGVQTPSYGLLEGVAGTALALLTAAAGTEPWWDYPLLIGSTDLA